MDFNQQQQVINAIIHFLIASKYSVPFWLVMMFILLFANRKASIQLLWRNFHLIEDLVLEKEFIKEIDVPLRLLTLSLIAVPVIAVLPEPFHFYLSKLFGIIIPVLLLQLFVKGVDLIVFHWYFEKHKATSLPVVLRTVTLSFIWIIFILVLLESVFGVNLLPLIATSTVATAVLGLALQDTLKNLFAGLTMSLEKRFQNGDWVTCRLDSNLSTTGEISEIGWRTTRLRTLDDTYSIVPNALFVTNHVINYSRPTPCYAQAIEFPVVASADPKRIQEILLQGIKGVDGILDEPPPEALANSVQADRVVYKLRFWVKDFSEGDTITGRVIANCMLALQGLGVIKPDEQPTQVLNTPPAVAKETAPPPATVQRSKRDHA